MTEPEFDLNVKYIYKSKDTIHFLNTNILNFLYIIILIYIKKIFHLFFI
jgi:hypothetical protein